jgi:hypothetical protein
LGGETTLGGAAFWGEAGFGGEGRGVAFLGAAGFGGDAITTGGGVGFFGAGFGGVGFGGVGFVFGSAGAADSLVRAPLGFPVVLGLKNRSPVTGLEGWSDLARLENIVDLGFGS